MRKIITVLIIVAILAAGGYGFYLWRQRQQAAQTSSLETTPAARGSLTATIGATGQVRSQQTAALSMEDFRDGPRCVRRGRRSGKSG